MKEVPLHGKIAAGRVALVDDADFDLVCTYRWFVWERVSAGGRPNGPYAQGYRLADSRRKKFMHKLLTSWPMTDHIDHDGLNNQRHNLRPTTTALNSCNQRPHLGTSSRFKGVTWHKQVGKWQAALQVNGRRIHLGLFDSEEEAALAYDAAALDAYGEHAYPNLSGIVRGRTR